MKTSILAEPDCGGTSSIRNSRTDLAKTLSIVVISDAAPSRNGVGTFYVDLLEHLRDEVKYVELICPRVEKGKWKAGLVFPLPGDNTQKLCFPNPIKVYRRLKDVNPDLIIIATPGVYGIVGSFFATRMNIPTVVGFHTSFEDITELYWDKTFEGKIIRKYFKLSNGYLFKNCQLVLANSSPMIFRAKNLGAPSTKEIPTLISPVFIKHPTPSNVGGCKKILFAGRLAPEKNLDSLIEAARNLPELQFSIAGDGPERDKIEENSDKLTNLSYLGWLKRTQLRDVIDDHDVLVLPSFFESFGTVTLEAMARKRLVVVSEGCGISASEEFESGFYRMQGQDLTECLSMISALDKRQRIKKAEQAYQLTHQMNYKNIEHWCELLVNVATS